MKCSMWGMWLRLKTETGGRTDSDNIEQKGGRCADPRGQYDSLSAACLCVTGAGLEEEIGERSAFNYHCQFILTVVTYTQAHTHTHTDAHTHTPI